MFRHNVHTAKCFYCFLGMLSRFSSYSLAQLFNLKKNTSLHSRICPRSFHGGGGGMGSWSSIKEKLCIDFYSRYTDILLFFCLNFQARDNNYKASFIPFWICPCFTGNVRIHRQIPVLLPLYMEL